MFTDLAFAGNTIARWSQFGALLNRLERDRSALLWLLLTAFAAWRAFRQGRHLVAGLDAGSTLGCSDRCCFLSCLSPSMGQALSSTDCRPFFYWADT